MNEPLRLRDPTYRFFVVWTPARLARGGTTTTPCGTTYWRYASTSWEILRGEYVWDIMIGQRSAWRLASVKRLGKILAYDKISDYNAIQQLEITMYILTILSTTFLRGRSREWQEGDGSLAIPLLENRPCSKNYKFKNCHSPASWRILRSFIIHDNPRASPSQLIRLILITVQGPWVRWKQSLLSIKRKEWLAYW